MRTHTQAPLIGGVYIASVSLPSNLLTAVEKVVIQQQGSLVIDAGGTIVDSTTAPSHTFELPARTAVFPACVPLTQEFSVATFGSRAGSNAAAWIENIKARIAQAYAALSSIPASPMEAETVIVQPSPSTSPQPTVPLGLW